MRATRGDPPHREREERDLAQRAARGDRRAFDRLYDRYFARMAWLFRDLPAFEQQAAIWEALEQVFAGLDAGELEVGERAFRIARQTGRTWPRSSR